MSDYTAEQIEAGISAALKAQDMPAVAGLLQMLAVKSPNDAQRILDTLDLSARSERAGITHQPQDGECCWWTPGEPSVTDVRCPICRLSNAV